jgi:hypothetical protein
MKDWPESWGNAPVNFGVLTVPDILNPNTSPLIAAVIITTVASSQSILIALMVLSEAYKFHTKRELLSYVQMHSRYYYICLQRVRFARGSKTGKAHAMTCALGLEFSFTRSVYVSLTAMHGRVHAVLHRVIL